MDPPGSAGDPARIPIDVLADQVAQFPTYTEATSPPWSSCPAANADNSPSNKHGQG
jgi:hypothetical protein